MMVCEGRLDGVSVGNNVLCALIEASCFKFTEIQGFGMLASVSNRAIDDNMNIHASFF